MNADAHAPSGPGPSVSTSASAVPRWGVETVTTLANRPAHAGSRASHRASSPPDENATRFSRSAPVSASTAVSRSAQAAARTATVSYGLTWGA